MGGRECNHSLPDRKARFQLSCLPTSPLRLPPLCLVAARTPPALDTKAFSALPLNSVEIMGDSFGSVQTRCLLCFQSDQTASIILDVKERCKDIPFPYP